MVLVIGSTYLTVWMGARLWRAVCGSAGRNVEAAGAKALRRQRMLNIMSVLDGCRMPIPFPAPMVMHL